MSKSLFFLAFLIFSISCTRNQLKSTSFSKLTGSLNNDGTLNSNSYIQSDDGVYQLWMQSDGNVVLYGCNKEVLWSTGTCCTSASRRLVMQTDGNLVLYEGNKAIWDSKTNGRGNQPFTLTLQVDGNLVLNSATAGAIWTSGTPGRGYCNLCATLASDNDAGTNDTINLYHYDTSANWYISCGIGGAKSRGGNYCCSPSNTSSPGGTPTGKLFYVETTSSTDNTRITSVNYSNTRVDNFTPGNNIGTYALGGKYGTDNCYDYFIIDNNPSVAYNKAMWIAANGNNVNGRSCSYSWGKYP
jgi:hypothetical protein